MKLRIKHREDILSHDYPEVGDVFFETKTYTDLTIGFTPEKGEAYALVYVIYGTGDSFIDPEPNHLEFVDMFEEMKTAVLLREALLEQHDKYKRDGFISIEESMKCEFDGKPYHTPWNGYFERLYEVGVKKVYFLGRER